MIRNYLPDIGLIQNLFGNLGCSEAELTPSSSDCPWTLKMEDEVLIARVCDGEAPNAYSMFFFEPATDFMAVG